jgi:hypothetical protein
MVDSTKTCHHSLQREGLVPGVHGCLIHRCVPKIFYVIVIQVWLRRRWARNNDETTFGLRKSILFRIHIVVVHQAIAWPNQDLLSWHLSFVFLVLLCLFRTNHGWSGGPTSKTRFGRRATFLETIFSMAVLVSGRPTTLRLLFLRRAYNRCWHQPRIRQIHWKTLKGTSAQSYEF